MMDHYHTVHEPDIVDFGTEDTREWFLSLEELRCSLSEANTP